MKLIKAIAIALTTVLFFCEPVMADDQAAVNKLIADFHQRSTNELLCRDSGWELSKDIGGHFKEYFSASLSHLYRHICTSVSVRFDPRYGDSPFVSNNHDDFIENRRQVSHVKVNPPQIKGNRAIVRVTFDHGEGSFARFGNFIRYRLLKENGNWRIDDIEIGGNEIRCDALRCFKSLRQELEDLIAEAKQQPRTGSPNQ